MQQLECKHLRYTVWQCDNLWVYPFVLVCIDLHFLPLPLCPLCSSVKITAYIKVSAYFFASLEQSTNMQAMIVMSGQFLVTLCW